MSLNAGLVEATADLNMRRFSQGMKQMKAQGASTSTQVTGSLDGIGRKLTSLTFLAQAFFGSALVMGARSAVREFALLEGATAKFDVVFGEMSKEMHQWVDGFRQNVPLARREIVQMSAALQDLLVPLGINRSEATKMTQKWLELAGALAAFNDVGVTEVLEAMQSAIAGQSRPLRRYGIDVRETALQQTALEHGIIGVNDSMNESARQQALLIQAYAQSQDALNGYEDQLGTTLMMEQELGAAFKETIALIGEKLQPSYNALTSTLAEFFNTIAQGANRATRRQQQFNETIGKIDEILSKELSDMGLGELTNAFRFVTSELSNLENQFDDMSRFPHVEAMYNRLKELHDQLGLAIFDVGRQAKETNVIPELSQEHLDSLERAQLILAEIRKQLAPTGDSNAIFRPGEIADDLSDLAHAWMLLDDFLGKDQIETLAESMGDVATQTERTTEVAQFFSRTFADGLDQVLFNARSVEDAIKGIARQLASRAMVTGLMALFGGGLPAGVSFGRAMFGGSFHTGGIVPGVGEKMINVKGGEMVLTRDQIKGIQMGSSQRDIRLTVNIRGDLQGRGDTLRAIIDEQVRQSVRLQ